MSLTLMLGVSISTAAGADGDPPKSPFAGKIIFFGSVLNDDLGSGLIQAMSPDGADLKTILKFQQPIQTGRVSPDGRRLAFSAASKEGGIWILEGDGHSWKLAEQGHVRCWSPDGKQVACLLPKAKDRAWESVVIEVETKQARSLPIPETDAIEDWSPDGRFMSVMDGNPAGRFEHPTKGLYPLRRIYLMNQDGSERKPLTDEPTFDGIWSRFSPDGRWVAHYRRRYRGEQPPAEISVVRRRDGSDASENIEFGELDNPPPFVRPSGAPCWSPDGKTLVWRCDKNEKDKPGFRRFELIFVSLNDGAIRRLKLSRDEIRFWGDIDWR